MVQNSADSGKKGRGKENVSKALIVRELLDGPLSFENLKDRMEQKGITRQTCYNLLYVGEGLANARIGKVVLERGHELSLNLKDGRALVKVIGILEKDPDVGPKIKYLLERAFVEAFFSVYGYLPSTDDELEYYFEEGNMKTKDILANYFLYLRPRIPFSHTKDDPDFERIPPWSEVIRSQFAGPFKGDGKDMSWVEIPRMEKPEKDTSAKVHKSISVLEEELETKKQLAHLNHEFREEKARSYLESINFNLISELISFIEKIKGKADIQYMTAYVLKIISNSESAKHFETLLPGELSYSYFKIRALSDIESISTRWIITRELDDYNPEVTDIFVEKIIRRAISGPVEVDRLLDKREDILGLYHGRIFRILLKRRERDSARREEFYDDVPVEEVLSQKTVKKS